MTGKVDCFGLTDPGKERPSNEDQFLFADLNKSMLVHQTSLNLDDHTRLFGGSQGRLLLVADGMGGHAAGERASSIAVDAVAHYVLNTMNWFLRLQASTEDDLRDDLKAALEKCQQRIEVAAGASSERRRMGTTLTMAYIVWPRLYVVHVGDSRCYLLRDGRLEQITTDHTVAQQLVERGVLRPEEAEASRYSHVLWNCLGGGTAELQPEVYKCTLRIGDTLMLCTDGLSGSLPNERIAALLSEKSSAEETCRRLVRGANDAGGRDNITVVVAHFRDLAQADTEEYVASESANEPDDAEVLVGDASAA